MPRFSADGTKVAYTSADESGNRDVYVVSLDGSGERRLTEAPSEEGRASWSGDGRSLYFRSDRSGNKQIWKLDLQTGGKRQLTLHGGYEAFEGPRGRRLYYVKSRKEPQLWSVPVDGGDEELVLEGVSEANWGVARDGIYFRRDRDIFRLPVGAGAPEVVFTIPDDAEIRAGFAVCPDAATVLWAQTATDGADIWKGVIEVDSPHGR